MVWAVLIALVLVFVLSNLTTSEKRIRYAIPSLYGVDDPQFVRSMGSLLGPPLTGGNRAQELINGSRIFPSMLEAIHGAARTITFETYIYWSGEIGRAFSEALSERARAGVRVHVLLDWVGAGKIDATYLDAMREAGVEVERYHPLRWYNLGRLNNRTHRKLLVVDGRVGFTGGVGIADPWLGDADSPEHWRDSHFRIEGPAVAQMQAAFMDNWLKTRATVLHGGDYFPALDPVGPHHAHVFRSSPGEGSESVRLMYLLSIASARESILLANAYFVPDDLSVEAFVDARRRGVEIDIIVPGRRTDAVITRRASRSRWGSLLEAGVRIHEYQPTMFHCKVMVVDERWVSVGSTNFDSRSFRLNDEANLNVLDAVFAARQAAVFRADLACSRQVTLDAWRRRPLREKLVERAAGLLRAQL
jgi:cardiolipin synthase